MTVPEPQKNGGMKSLRLTFVAAILTPAVTAVADVDVKSLVTDAVENTFAGENYSWTSTMPRPDGVTLTVEGQIDHGTTYVVMKDGATTRTMIVVSGRRFVLTPAGWREAGLPQLPPDGAVQPPPPRQGGPVGLGGPGIRGGPESPERRLRAMLAQVTTWTAQGDTLTGQFTAQPDEAGHRGPPPEAVASLPAAETVTVALRVQDGLVSDAQLTKSITLTTQTGESLTRQHTTSTHFGAIGATKISVPTDVATLLAGN